MSPQDELLDKITHNNKAKLKGRKENDKAYNDLILVYCGEIGFVIVDELMTKELPDVDAEFVWSEL